MRILLLSLNYAPEAIGTGPYSAGLSEHLAAAGHQVHVVAAQPYYPQWRVFDGYRGWWRRTRENGVEITRCPVYVTRKPTGIRRLVHYTSFAASALLPVLRAAVRFRPDLVMTVAPSLIAAPVAWLAAKVARGSSWLHIQDFEVEAAFATGLLDERSRSAQLARAVERRTIGLFDQLSSISPEMCAKLASFGVPPERVTEFRNWAEVDAIRPLSEASPYRSEWDIRTPHVALYSGNIANKQGIEILEEAARLLLHREDLTFVICGQGPNRAELQARARDLPNVRFCDLQPRERLGDLLGLATVHLLPQKANAADLVLPSKLTNMLASGRPVVATAAAGTGLAREVAGCGIVVPPGNATALTQAIERLLDNPDEWSRLAAAARQRAESTWSRRAILANITDRIERQIEPGHCASHTMEKPAKPRKGFAVDTASEDRSVK